MSDLFDYDNYNNDLFNDLRSLKKIAYLPEIYTKRNTDNNSHISYV